MKEENSRNPIRAFTEKHRILIAGALLVFLFFGMLTILLAAWLRSPAGLYIALDTNYYYLYLHPDGRAGIYSDEYMKFELFARWRMEGTFLKIYINDEKTDIAADSGEYHLFMLDFGVDDNRYLRTPFYPKKLREELKKIKEKDKKEKLVAIGNDIKAGEISP